MRGWTRRPGGEERADGGKKRAGQGGSGRQGAFQLQTVFLSGWPKPVQPPKWVAKLGQAAASEQARAKAPSVLSTGLPQAGRSLSYPIALIQPSQSPLSPPLSRWQPVVGWRAPCPSAGCIPVQAGGGRTGAVG